MKGSLTTPIGNPGSGGNCTVADPSSFSPASLETLDYKEVMRFYPCKHVQYRNDCSDTDAFNSSNLLVLYLIRVIELLNGRSGEDTFVRDCTQIVKNIFSI